MSRFEEREILFKLYNIKNLSRDANAVKGELNNKWFIISKQLLLRSAFSYISSWKLILIPVANERSNSSGRVSLISPFNRRLNVHKSDIFLWVFFCIVTNTSLSLGNNPFEPKNGICWAINFNHLTTFFLSFFHLSAYNI